jgi:hypothetical protein
VSKRFGVFVSHVLWDDCELDDAAFRLIDCNSLSAAVAVSNEDFSCLNHNGTYEIYFPKTLL